MLVNSCLVGCLVKNHSDKTGKDYFNATFIQGNDCFKANVKEEFNLKPGKYYDIDLRLGQFGAYVVSVKVCI